MYLISFIYVYDINKRCLDSCLFFLLNIYFNLKKKTRYPTMIRSSFMNLYSGISILVAAGPFRMRPAASKCEPWHGQKKPPGIMPAFGIGTHPKCVQIPNTINHSGFLTLSSSVSGSRSPDKLTALSCSIIDRGL